MAAAPYLFVVLRRLGWLHRVFDDNSRAVEKWPDWKKSWIKTEVDKSMSPEEVIRQLRHTYPEIDSLYQNNAKFKAYLEERLDMIHRTMPYLLASVDDARSSEIRDAVLEAWGWAEAYYNEEKEKNKKIAEEIEREERVRTRTRWDMLP